MGDEVAVTLLSTDELVADESTQWRAKRSDEAIEEMAEHLRAGGTLPPLDVFDDGATMRVADGHHRLAAYRASNTPQVPARVHRGDADAAFLFGVRANVRNKAVRAERADLRRAALEMMRRPGIAMSDSAIARELGVSQPTIHRWHQEWSVTYSLNKSTDRVGRDGRTINTANIGKRSEPKAEESPVYSGEVVPAQATTLAPIASALFEDDDLDPGEPSADEIETTEAVPAQPAASVAEVPRVRDLDEMNAATDFFALCADVEKRAAAIFARVHPQAMRDSKLKGGCEGAAVRMIQLFAGFMPPEFRDEQPTRWQPKIISGGKS